MSISTLTSRSALLLTLLAGCVGPGDIAEDVELEGCTQAFSAGRSRNLQYTLTPHILHSSSIRVCLDSSNTDFSLDTQKAYIRDGLAKWIASAATVSKERLFEINDLVFSCDALAIESQPDSDVGVLRVFWSNQPGRAHYLNSNVFLYAGDTAKAVLHELGHAFGLSDTYDERTGKRRPGQPDSVMAGGRTYSRLQPDDMLGIQQVFCEAHEELCIKRFESSEFYCRGPNLYLGDFNGDGKSDSLCHDAHGEITIDWSEDGAPLGASQFFNNLQFCRGDGARLFTADVTADGRDELLCHEPTGRIAIHYANAAGRFIDAPVSHNLGFCTEAGAGVHTGDFNQDGRADLLCHESGGALAVALANTSGHFSSFQRLLVPFCAATSALPDGGSESPELHVGDFDGNGRDDLLCHYPVSGKKQIAYASELSASFERQWEAELGWCNGAGAELRVGLFNRDARTDMLCLTERGDLDVALAESDGSFVGTARSWWPEWCVRLPWRQNPPLRTTRHLLLGDFDANGVTDLLCYTPDSANRELWLGQTRLPGERQ